MKKFLCILLAGSLMLSLPAKTRKSVYIIIDGVPADQIERLQPPAIFDIASHGGYARAYTGGDVGEYSQTPTISAVGYTNLLTATWYNKHNVGGNDNLSPNYNYWTVFRIAEEQDRCQRKEPGDLRYRRESVRGGGRKHKEGCSGPQLGISLVHGRSVRSS